MHCSSTAPAWAARNILAFGLLLTSAVAATAAPITVSDFGDFGWFSDDTRDAAGNNLVGATNTNAGKPGQAATAADDTAIEQQIKFVAGPAGSTYGGAVSIDGTSGNNGKSNIATINTAGFAAASSLLSSSFSATYGWYGQPNPSSRTLAFKLGIQSTDWGTGSGDSQNGFTATRSGESAWDLVLVHTGLTSDLVWTTETVDNDTGTWFLFDQAGNPFFTPPGNVLGQDKTLAAWSLDPIWGPKLFDPGAIVTSIQFGLGSSQRDSIAYLDALQTNLLNNGDVVNFGPAAAPVPEPATMMLLGSGLFGLAARRRNRSKR